MGCYDSVNFSCPRCDSQIEVQSKAGSCSMSNFRPDEVPHVIANDLKGEVVYCQKCNRSFIVVEVPPIPRSLVSGWCRRDNP